jgi:hypothetical protein
VLRATIAEILDQCGVLARFGEQRVLDALFAERLKAARIELALV